MRRRLPPHTPSRDHAVAFDSQLPPTGSVRDLHPQSIIHVQRTLPAYGLQASRIANQNPKTKSNPNTPRLPITLGGHFYLAENRTFLLCADTTQFVLTQFVIPVGGVRAHLRAFACRFAFLYCQHACLPHVESNVCV